MKTKRARQKVPAARPSAASHQTRDDFLIVAIGASAGGLEAFRELISDLPADTGMAFVLVQHLDPEHHSILTDIIARQTRMPVHEAANGMRVEPNHVYVIPPNASMAIFDHTLQIGPRQEPRGMHMPIDAFMRSLAQAHADRAVGVILSGSGSDGTLGMAEIQAQGGVTLVQSEESAKHDGMPHSVITAGRADCILAPRGIARELARIASHPFVSRDPKADDGADFALSDSASLGSVFRQLRRITGVDFTYYRKTTILRRIHRRMMVHRFTRLDEYVRYLHTDPVEINALHQDMLINVTSFFRDPGVFEALKTVVFPTVFKDRTHDTAARIWVPGCASGEEIYSIAIVLLEFLGDNAALPPIQFFGTDVSESSIAKARDGVYPENIQGDVSPERLRRFFTRVDGSYRISKHIRDMCVFAQHNVADDPPFSQMDLVCCRNLLIYLEPILQTKIISVFHYALRPGGYLVLGNSEGLGAAAQLFACEDRTHKIFLKKTSATRPVVSFSLSRKPDRRNHGRAAIPTPPQDGSWNYMEAQKEFDRQLLTHYAPAAVFVTEDLELVHSRGNLTPYLKLPPGRASLGFLKMAREGLFLELRNALARVQKERTTVRRRGVQIRIGNGPRGKRGPEPAHVVDFEVIPITAGKPETNYFMIVFSDSAVQPSSSKALARVSVSSRKDKGAEESLERMVKLEQELAATKEYLQSVIETHEATNEELQSANEEILSSNEELQSTNEELETAKEELQSTNEELNTVNDELRNRNADVHQVNTDLTNLLASIDIAVLMVAKDLTIRRFTLPAQQLFGLIPGDVGRPLLNINSPFSFPDLHALILRVIAESRPVEQELPGPDATRYQARILPYRTADNKTEGAVVTLVNLSRQVGV